MSPHPSCHDRLEIPFPWMNAAGFLGYSPSSSLRWETPMGAFVTHPISLAPRKPALLRQVQEYPGGILLHTGLPNPGFQRVLKQNAEKWSKLDIPVWVHLLPQTPSDLSKMIEPLEFLENINAVELGIPAGIPLSSVLEYIQAAAGELPVMVCIGMDEIQSEWMQPIAAAGAAGVVLSAPRGMMKADDHLIRGRLYGPAVFPQMLKTVCRLAQFDLPIIASGGVFTVEDGQTLMDSGACAVQLDAVLWAHADF
jgi:dihydroorotate dehydrogenase (NAD+) catalytic subunit